MAINLGNIRSAGFRKGLATGFIKSETAKADADRREKEYQQLLAREQTNRDFQAEQSSLSRASSVEQARLTREAQTKRYETTDSQFTQTLDVQKNELAFKKELQKTARDTNLLNLQLKELTLKGTPITPELRSQLTEQFSNVVNASVLMDLHNVGVGVTKDKDTLKVATALVKTILDGKNTTDTFTQEQIDKFKAVGSPFFTTYDTVAKINSQINSSNNRKVSGKINSNFNPRTIEGGISFNVYTPSARISAIGTNTTDPTTRLANTFSLLRVEDANLYKALDLGNNTKGLPEKSIEGIHNFYVEHFRRFANGIQGKDSTTQYRLTRDYMEKGGNLKGFKQLVEKGIIKPDNIFKESGIDTVAETTNNKYIPNINVDKLQKLQQSDTLDSDVENMLMKPKAVISGSSSGTDVLQGGQGEDNLNKERRTLFQSWRAQGFKMSSGPTDASYEGKSYKVALLNTFKDSTGRIDMTAYRKLITAIDISVSDFEKTFSQDGSSFKTSPNKRRILSAKAKEVWSPLVKSSRLAIQNAAEVTNIAESIRDISSALSSSGNIGVGTASNVVGSAARLVQIVTDFKTVGVGNIKEMFDKFRDKPDGPSISQLKEQALSSNSLRGLNEEEIKRRKRTLGNLDNKVTSELKDIRANNSISLEVKQLRELIVFKKIALTYRMSGLLQGDASGRSISNQDFEYALKAVWGESYAVEVKMDAIIEFFDQKKMMAQTILDYSNEGIGDIAMSLTSDQSNESSRRLSERMTKEIQNNPSLQKYDAARLPATSPVRRGMEDVLKPKKNVMGLLTGMALESKDFVNGVKNMSEESSDTQKFRELNKNNRLVELVKDTAVIDIGLENNRLKLGLSKDDKDELSKELTRSYMLRLWETLRTNKAKTRFERKNIFHSKPR